MTVSEVCDELDTDADEIREISRFSGMSRGVSPIGTDMLRAQAATLLRWRPRKGSRGSNPLVSAENSSPSLMSACDPRERRVTLPRPRSLFA